MRRIVRFVKDIIDFPKTFYVNFKCLDFRQAIKLPIKINYKVKIGNVYKGCFIINGNIRRSMIKFGYSGAGFVSENKSYIYIYNGKMKFEGDAVMAEGFNIYINGGVVTVGKKFYANKNFQLQSEENIYLGEDCLVGWNVSIRDTDGHRIVKEGKEFKEKGNIRIGKHVWIAAHTIILKDSYITDGCVIGCRSLICGIKMKDNNCLIAGVPAKVKRNNIFWIE